MGKFSKVQLVVLMFSLGYAVTVGIGMQYLNKVRADTSNCPIIIERECYTKTDKGDFQLIVRTTCGNK